MVRGSIPGDVTVFFIDVSPSDRTMVLGSTHRQVKMCIRNFMGDKGGRWVRMKNSPNLRAECHGKWDVKAPITCWATPGLLRDCFNFTFTQYHLCSPNYIHVPMQYNYAFSTSHPYYNYLHCSNELLLSAALQRTECLVFRTVWVCWVVNCDSGTAYSVW